MAKIRVTKDGSLTHWGKFEPYGERSAFPSWEAFVEFNETQPCSNPACEKKLRRARSKFCSQCGIICKRFGDPRWKEPHPKEYKADILKAKDIIAFNLDNILILDFVSKVETLALQGNRKLGMEWQTWWAQIHLNLNKSRKYQKRDPYDILAELVGLYTFYDRTGCDEIKSEKMWYWLLAGIMLRGVKAQVRPRACSTRVHKFGKYIWAVFSVYFIKLGRASMQNDIRKQLREKQLNEAELNLPEDRKKGELEQ